MAYAGDLKSSGTLNYHAGSSPAAGTDSSSSGHDEGEVRVGGGEGAVVGVDGKRRVREERARGGEAHGGGGGRLRPGVGDGDRRHERGAGGLGVQSHGVIGR